MPAAVGGGKVACSAGTLTYKITLVAVVSPVHLVDAQGFQSHWPACVAEPERAPHRRSVE